MRGLPYHREAATLAQDAVAKGGVRRRNGRGAARSRGGALHRMCPSPMHTPGGCQQSCLPGSKACGLHRPGGSRRPHTAGGGRDGGRETPAGSWTAEDYRFPVGHGIVASHGIAAGQGVAALLHWGARHKSWWGSMGSSQARCPSTPCGRRQGPAAGHGGRHGSGVASWGRRRARGRQRAQGRLRHMDARPRTS